MPRIKPYSPRFQADAAIPGCRAAWTFPERAGDSTANHVQGGRRATLSGVTWGAGVYGPQVGLTASSRGYDHSAAIGAPAWPVWSEALFRWGGGDGDQYFVFHGSTAGDQFTGLLVKSGAVGWNLYDGTTGAFGAQTGFFAIDGTRVHHLLGISYGPSDHRVYLNGVLAASDATTIGTFACNRFGLNGIERATFGGGGLVGDLIAASTGYGAAPHPHRLYLDRIGGAFADVRPRRRPTSLIVPAAGGASGTLAVTLGSMTLAASGTAAAAPAATGSLSVTLGATTLAAAGTAAAAGAAVGSLAVTLGAATLAATGTAEAAPAAAGTLDLTLGPATLAATGTAAAAGAAGTLDLTLGATTLAATGSAGTAAPASGSLAVTLGPATLAATGSAWGTRRGPTWFLSTAARVGLQAARSTAARRGLASSRSTATRR